MSSTQDRRSFFSVLASLAGVAMVDSSVERAAAQAPARPSGQWDMTWLDQFKGKHKQVFDYGTFDLSVDGRPLRFVRNYLDACRDVYSLEHPDVNTAVGISRAGFPINASDAIWQKYRLGERWKIQDPSTKQPAVRNIFLDGASGGADISVKGLQAKGTFFWQCNVALGGVAGACSSDADARPGRTGRVDRRAEPRREARCRARAGALGRARARLHVHEALIRLATTSPARADWQAEAVVHEWDWRIPCRLPVIRRRLESDAPPWRLGRGFHQLPDGVEHDFELRVVLSLQDPELSGQLFMRGKNLTESNEGPHDGDVHSDRAFAPEDTREHSHALFGECVGPSAARSTPT